MYVKVFLGELIQWGHPILMSRIISFYLSSTCHQSIQHILILSAPRVPTTSTSLFPPHQSFLSSPTLSILHPTSTPMTTKLVPPCPHSLPLFPSTPSWSVVATVWTGVVSSLLFRSHKRAPWFVLMNHVRSTSGELLAPSLLDKLPRGTGLPHCH